MALDVVYEQTDSVMYTYFVERIYVILHSKLETHKFILPSISEANEQIYVPVSIYNFFY